MSWLEAMTSYQVWHFLKNFKSAWICNKFQVQVRRTACMSLTHLKRLHYFGIFLEITNPVVSSYFCFQKFGSWLDDWMQSLCVCETVWGISGKGRLKRRLMSHNPLLFWRHQSAARFTLLYHAERCACGKSKRLNFVQKVRNTCFYWAALMTCPSHDVGYVGGLHSHLRNQNIVCWLIKTKGEKKQPVVLLPQKTWEKRVIIEYFCQNKWMMLYQTCKYCQLQCVWYLKLIFNDPNLFRTDWISSFFPGSCHHTNRVWCCFMWPCRTCSAVEHCFLILVTHLKSSSRFKS